MQTFNLWADPQRIQWLGCLGWAAGAEHAVDRFDRPLSALVEHVRHTCDIGQRPDLPVIRKHLALIEARLMDQLDGLDADFDSLAERQSRPVPPELRSRTRAALELVQGKAKATEEWLLAMAAQPPVAAVEDADDRAAPKRRAVRTGRRKAMAAAA